MSLQNRLAENGFETPANISLVLLVNVLHRAKTWILTHGEYRLTQSENNTLQSKLEQLLQGVPLAYLLGEWEFYGRRFYVNPSVLIPRPETELLIEHAIRSIKDNIQPLILDVGCGSGIIAITLAAMVPQARIIASDLSRPALEVTRLNAARHEVQILLLQADLLQPFHSKFDLICANLPYIPAGTLGQLEVVRWEPRLALDGGATGLEAIKRLLDQARSRLTSGGILLLEIEASLGQNAMNEAKTSFPTAEIQMVQDLAGKDRLVKIQLG